MTLYVYTAVTYGVRYTADLSEKKNCLSKWQYLLAVSCFTLNNFDFVNAAGLWEAYDFVLWYATS